VERYVTLFDQFFELLDAGLCDLPVFFGHIVLNNLIRTVRATGKIGVVGLYVPEEGAPDDATAEGRLGIDFGKLFEKGQRFGTGQCNVKQYNRRLRDMIIEGRADPTFLVSHREPLENAPEMYERFDNREEGFTKVLLEP
jgi:threonine dehydrogenase-like Zn-dependent dehydrogenase